MSRLPPTPPSLVSTSTLLARMPLVPNKNIATQRLLTGGNDLSTLRNEIRVIKKRARTTTLTWSPLFDEDAFESARAYGDKYFEQIVYSLRQKQLQTSRMVLKHYEWLVPGDETTTTQLAIYDAMRTRAPTVTNAQLGLILKMELSTPDSPDLPPGHHFYCRSIPFTVPELRDFIEYFRQDELMYEELKEWDKLLAIYEASDPSMWPIFTIRYIGSCQGPKRPIDRYLHDLKYRTDSILSEFFNVLEAHFPEVAKKVEVHLLSDASVPADATGDLFAEDTERILVEFCHYPTLLNRQLGGYHSGFLPDVNDAENFRACATDFWNDFRHQARMAPDDMLVQLDAHYHEMQLYANEHPGESGTAKHLFTDRYRTMAEQQSTLHLYEGHNVLAFIGKDVTVSGYLNEDTFLESRSGVLVRDIVSRTVESEAEANGRAILPQSFKAAQSPWVFRDLWPWLWHKNIDQAIVMLRQYCGITKPLIIVSYGRVVNGVVKSDFQHQNGVGMTANFTTSVGKATLQYYNDPKDPSQKPEDNCTINIPHIHPGRDKYGSQDITLRRVYELSMHWTFLFGHVALEVLDNHRHDDVHPTRHALCQEILDKVNELRKTGPAKAVHKALREARKALAKHFTDARTDHAGVVGLGLATSSDDVRPMMNNAGTLRLTSFGQAEGEPDSAERVQQLNVLWDLNMPDLHIVVAHEDDKKQDWIKSLQSLPSGHYYYLAVLDQAPADEYTKHVLKTFAPADVKGTTWMEDNDLRRQATLRAGLWIQKHPNAGHKLFRAHPQPFVSAAEQQGRPIGINASSGYGLIRWKAKE